METMASTAGGTSGAPSGTWAPEGRSRTPAPPRRTRTGTWALLLALVGVVGSLAVSVVIGGSVGPMENAHGYYFTDTPRPYQTLIIGLALSYVLWGLLALAGLVVGIVAVVDGAGRWRGVAAIVLAVLMPVLALNVSLAALMLTV